MLLGLRTVIFPVENVEKARDWYRGFLGSAPTFDQPFYVGFSVGGFELGLIPGTPGTGGPQPLWGVADIEAVHGQLLALGAKELEPIQDVGDGIKTAAVVDPFGNRLGIIFNPHFKTSDVR